jgi:peptidase YpeB-like protein
MQAPPEPFRHTASMRARHFLHRLRVPLCALAIALAALPVGARELSAQEAVAKVQQETSGKVLSVQTLTMGKRKFYRIKVLTPDGQVRVVQVAAEQ